MKRVASRPCIDCVRTERDNELICEERKDNPQSTHCFPDRVSDTSCSSRTSFSTCSIRKGQNKNITLKRVPCSSGDGQAIELQLRLRSCSCTRPSSQRLAS